MTRRGFTHVNDTLHPNSSIFQPQYRGHALATDFQPIVAVAHMRAVGAEALLRPSDSAGASIPPLELFAKAALRQESQILDRLAQETHFSNFTEYSSENRWLFLNCHPDTLILGSNDHSILESVVERHGLNPSHVVIEVLEHAAFSNEAIIAAITTHQKRGFLIAIDDFGTGWSNLDRVWGVHPDFVKLDRSIVRRAALSRHDRRVTKMLISMLHQMGVMVVAEGVETSEEALTVMDADVDFLQGFHFGRPSRDLRCAGQFAEECVRKLWPQLSDLVIRVGVREHAQITVVRSMLRSAARELQVTGSFDIAAKRFFTAPDTLSCLLLDIHGVQVGACIERLEIDNSFRSRTSPLFPSAGANWSRRPYYKDAVKRPGHPSVYGPHCSLTNGGFVYTTAMTVETDNGPFVLCGNFRLEQQELRVNCSSLNATP